MKKKIIISTCYGSYGWSHLGILSVLEKKGFSDLHFFIGDYPNYMEVDRSEFIFLVKGNDWHICARDVDPNDVYDNATQEEIDDMSDSILFNTYSFLRDREDQDAIAVLEEFGSEYCSSEDARLEVCEFDDCDGLFRCHIEEYDGLESIWLEPHLTESQVLQCSTVNEVLDLMRKVGVVHKD